MKWVNFRNNLFTSTSQVCKNLYNFIIPKSVSNHKGKKSCILPLPLFPYIQPIHTTPTPSTMSQLSWVKVEQKPPSVSIQEGANGTIYCKHSGTASDHLHWYRQHPGKSLASLFSLVSNGVVKQERHLTATLDTKSSLHITAAQPRDSAVYLCAVETQCFLSIWSLYTNSKAKMHLYFSHSCLSRLICLSHQTDDVHF
uniref:Ig-like domain-containing protein n=1 Tax=Sus scrofa TaxID=9823 RepID=A0A4X1UXT3_PIG